MRFRKFLRFIGNIKVKTRVILLLLVTAYVSILFVTSTIFVIGKNTLNQQIEKELALSAENIMNSINKMIYERYGDLQFLIGNSILIDPHLNIEEKGLILKNSLIKLGWYDDLYLTNNQGTVVTATNKSSVGLSVAEQGWFKETQNDFVFVSDIISSPFNDKKTLLFASVVTDENNNILGTLFGEFSWKVIEDLLKHTVENSEVFLVARDGRIIAQKNPNISNLQTIDQIYEKVNYDDHIITTIKSSGYLGFNGNGWQLIVQMPKSIAYAPINTFSRLILVVTGFISILVLLIGNRFAKIFVKPIKKLIQGVKKIEEGYLEQKITIETNDEFGFLAKNFNHMSASLLEKTKNILAEKGKYAAILESNEAGIVLVDKNNKVIAVNKTFSKIFNYKGNPLGKQIHDLFSFLNNIEESPEMEKNVAKIEKIVETKDLISKLRIELGLGKPFFKIFNLFSQPVKTEENKLLGRLWVFNDITEERESERSKDEFTRVASHKLRTPLTALNWTLQLFESDSLGSLTKEQKNVLGQIDIHTGRLNDLVKVLLSAAEIEKNRLPVKLKAFNIYGAIKSAKESTLRSVLPKKNVTIKLPPESQKDINVKADEEKIKQVLSMIIKNSHTYCQEKRKNDIRIELKPNKTKNELIVSISDTGLGITEQDLPKVFDKFFRGEKAVLSDTEGTGLNLYLVKIIIESHKQRIWIESLEGLGTTVFFSLELAEKSKTPR